jgi:hypothetical protein
MVNLNNRFLRLEGILEQNNGFQGATQYRVLFSTLETVGMGGKREKWRGGEARAMLNLREKKIGESLEDKRKQEVDFATTLSKQGHK